MKRLTVAALRQHLFQVVDELIETGVPVEIERGGYRLRLMRVDRRNKLDKLKPHNAIVGYPDDLPELKVGEWSAGESS